MGKLNDLLLIREESALGITTPEAWQNALAAISEYWKMNFDEAIQIYAQAPRANTLTTFDGWNKIGRYINGGERAISVVTADNKIKNYFDISQTNGRAIEPKWRIGLNETQKYYETLLADLSFNYQKGSLQEFVRESAMFLCCRRCGIIYEPNFKYIQNITNVSEVLEIGKSVSETAQNILKKIEKNIRRNNHEYSNESAPSGIHRQGRGAVPEHRNTEAVNQSQTDNENIHGYRQYSRGDGGAKHIGGQDLRGNSGTHNGKGIERNGQIEEIATFAGRLHGESGINDGVFIASETDSERVPLGTADGTQTREQVAVSDGIIGIQNKGGIDHKLYKRLDELFPDFINKKYNYMRLESDGFEPLSLEWVFGDRISVMHTYTQNGDLCYDPMIEFVVNTSERTLSAVMFEQSQPSIYQYFDEDGVGRSVDGNGNESIVKNLKQNISDFSLKWFENINEQEYIPVKALLWKSGRIDEADVEVMFDSNGNAVIPDPPKNSAVQLSLSGDEITYTAEFDEQIIKKDLLRGSSFQDGKFRIEEFAKTNPDTADFAKFLAKEYGIGGSTIPEGFSNHDGKGIKIDLYNRGNGEYRAARSIKLNWNQAAKHITELVRNGEYITQKDIEQRIKNAKWEIKEYAPPAETDTSAYNPAFSNNKATYEQAKAVLVSYGKLEEAIEEQRGYIDELEYNISGSAGDIDDERTLLSAREVLADLETEFEETLPDEETAEREETAGETALTASPVETVTAFSKLPVDETVIVNNFSRLNGGNFYSNGAKAKYRDNVAAIKTLREIENENRTATPDEQLILSRYVGWGGLSSAFDDKADAWSYEYAELKTLLTEDEYAAAFKSTLTAYYTDPYIIAPVYETLERFGFNGGRILDPCMGTGNFFSMLPAEIAGESILHGIELDSVSGRISKLLFPSADITIDGYEYVKVPDNSYDVIIGNVPFSEIGVYDRNYENNYLTHDYFFIKSLDKLKPGGILAFITATGTLDKITESARIDMAERAKLIGAVRLPNNAFKDIAGTTVSTDIIFMQKREEPLDGKLPDWVEVEWSQIFKSRVNRYFDANPEMVLGEAKNISGRYGWTLEIHPRENQDLYTDLRIALRNLNAEFTAAADYEEETEQDEDENAIPANPDDCDFTFIVREDVLYYCENRKLTPYETKNPAQTERIKAMDALVTQIQNLITFQIEGFGESVLEQARTRLNLNYDEFVKDYGRINDRVNTSLFNDDIRSALLLSVEKENIETKEFEKTDFFYQNTVRINNAPEHAGTSEDALFISLNLKQKVDIEYMAALCGKTCDEVISELGRKIYLNPAKYAGDIYKGWELAEEYLCGRVKDKLAAAILAAEQNPDIFNRNVTALKENQPDIVSIEDIGFTIGTIYIPEEMYRSFMYDTFKTPAFNKAENAFKRGDAIDINYNQILNEWMVSSKSAHRSVIVDEEFGTGRINAYAIFEQSLNQKKVEIKDKKTDRDGKVKYVLNKNETTLARDRQNKLEAGFRKWIYDSSERCEKIEKIYNERFNNVKPRVYDGSYINIPGMNSLCSLRPHQKDVIARILNAGTAMMAHEVGAGKTAAMAAAGMYLKSIGAISKPLYIVPKPIVGQWHREFLTFFPTANILVTNETDFEKKNRRRFLSKIATGNFDAVIMSHSQFEKVPLSLERQERMYEKKINTVSEQIKALEESKGNRFSVKRMAATQERLRIKLEKLRADFKKDNYVTFEELGCDFLFIDEAHVYKNLAIFSKMHNVAGINTSANSQRATDMEMKSRYIQELNNGGGVVFATGTPISNTLSELFVMQHFLQPNTLKRLNIDYFDNWASVFGKTTSALELKPSGNGFRIKTRFSQFHNLPELCNLMSEVFDIKKTADMGLKLPQIEGGKPEMIVCEKSPEQEAQTQIGLLRADDIENKRVTPEEDNMLSVCTYMIKVALDARIIDPAAEDSPESKLNICASRIIEIDYNNPGTTQVVFCDTNTPKKDGFSVYNALKETLINSGHFKESDIAFIHDANNDEQRLNLFSKINKGDIKVIIGSTSKLGTGVNIQEHLIAAHHLDAPFLPAYLEQRNGRLIRQGNTNDEVYVLYYSTKGTFDAYRWQILEQKARWISQIMSGKPPSRSCEDIDEVTLNFAQMKAATTENPLIAEKLTVDNEVERLTVLQRDWLASQKYFRKNIDKYYPEQIEKQNDILKNILIDIDTMNHNPVSDFEITIQGKVYDERKKAGERLVKLGTEYIRGKDYTDYAPVAIGKYRGLELKLVRSPLGLDAQIDIEFGTNTSVYSGFSFNEIGVITKIENLANKLLGKPDLINNEISYLNEQLASAKKLIKPFEYENELKTVINRQLEINSELEFGKNDEELFDEEEISGNGEMEI